MDEEKNLNVEKPPCPLIGQDGNIFNLVGIAARTLREAGLRDQANSPTAFSAASATATAKPCA